MSLLKVKNAWSGHTFPHPSGRRPIAYDALRMRTGMPLSNVMAFGKDLGPIFEVRVFSQKFVFVASAELAAELCDETRFHKALPPALVALREFVGDALFTAHDEEQNWHTAQGVLIPSFAKPAMREYHATMR